VLNRRHAL